jgi:hypothetical protein
MASLIVVCPHCLTWIETHAETCTECGRPVSVDDRDPSVEDLTERLGVSLADIGPMKLLRRGWPECGRLLATTEGLLFVPRFVVQPNGALQAATDDGGSGTARVPQLFHWWSEPARRTPAEEAVAGEPPTAELSTVPVLNLLFDSPGAFFIRRESIHRIIVRWSRAEIERRPSRTVSLAQASSGPNPRDALRSLNVFSPWQGIVAGL